VLEVAGGSAKIELGEGIQATCRIASEQTQQQSSISKPTPAKADIASLTSMLQARWKGAESARTAESPEVRAGQVRSFRVMRIQKAEKTIEVELA
jgi:small subunit ribosomal protein S1